MNRINWNTFLKKICYIAFFIALLWNAFQIPVSIVQADLIYNSAFLTDEQLTNDQAMSQSQIQTFLEGKGSYLANTIQDVDGQTFNPSQVISTASTQYQINPQVILTTLQKESSSITRSSPPLNLGFIGGAFHQIRPGSKSPV